MGRGPALVLCEHASNAIPARYDGLGLHEEDRRSHAAWDPGALALARRLAEALDAPLVSGTVSRLVYDLNRPPEAASAMPTKTETVDVPGNIGLSPEERARRTREVYDPFCAAVTGTVVTRKTLETPFALITVHSFTPCWFGVPREVEIGILHDADSRLADRMLDEASRLPGRCIARNDPYGPEDGVTHSLKLHGIANELPNVMIEVRNDLLADQTGIETIAGELLTLLRPALAGLGLTETDNA
ncbi:N-formylglutamate amidohydrolase [Alloyangia pacifica]|uniref:N-formylglutamate amidohydrolase n=1 Tax=Alloyangia pacifica TaxID=311180 RepID=A0A2U8HD46_9RHOB|nr:N-formylglutamate amidohydrolase [Alloyangia pacifica]AWI82956.1 N-formylglutamate amidohydrolase [Alloyangia pacifica]